MQRNKCKKTGKLLGAVIVILISVISCVTLAFIFTNTLSVTNTFRPAKVSCNVNETFENNEKTKVSIQNTGEVQSYIRAKIVVTWMSRDEKKVTAATPVRNTDYEMVYAKDKNWQYGADGYWYYTRPVDSGSQTGILIESCKLKSGAAAPPEDFYLSVEIVASSIQAVPAKVAEEQWKSGVEGVDVDGTTLIIKEGEETNA